MKKIMNIRYFLLLLTLVCSSVSATVIKIATISPDGTGWMEKMRAGADLIKQKTQGRVTFKFYPGGVMGSDEVVLRKIRIGQLQGGAVTSGNMSEVLADIDIYGLPFLFNSLAQVDAARKQLDARLMAELEAKGFVSFGLAGGGFAYMMSENPVRTVADARKQKVWTPSGNDVGDAVFESANISPVSLPISDVLTAMQTGLIDTIFTSPIGAIALQWHTGVKYVIDVPLTYFSALLVIDKKTFDKLGAEDAVLVRQVMENVFQEIDAQNRQDNIAARAALKNQGIQFITLSPETLSEWHAIGAKAAKKLEHKNRYNKAIYNELMQLVAANKSLH